MSTATNCGCLNHKREKKPTTTITLLSNIHVTERTEDLSQTALAFTK